MKVVVFGANGKVGSQVVKELIRQKYIVTAFVHSEPKESHSAVKYVKGDIYKTNDVMSAVSHNDAVVSCLGSWGSSKKNILSRGMTTIIPAMQAAKITRIISLTGADAWMPDEKPHTLQKVMHGLFSKLANGILRDGEKHMKLLQKSGLDWTVVRSPIMNERGSKQYRLNQEYPKPWQTINRQAVAKAMCDELSKTDHIHAAPYLHRA